MNEVVMVISEEEILRILTVPKDKCMSIWYDPMYRSFMFRLGAVAGTEVHTTFGDIPLTYRPEGAPNTQFYPDLSLFET